MDREKITEHTDFLADLNEAQREAVEYIDGPSLVVAGAGSGKTRVLTYKIAYLLTKGFKPWEIMALTFTNKAANEMKERIGALVGTEMARNIRMGTFHSIFARILRAEASKLGYGNNYTIYEDSDSKSLVKSIIKEFNLNDKIYKPADVHRRISEAKNLLMTAEQYAADGNAMTRDENEKVPQVATIYKIYEERCKKSNAMDFDDLLANTFRLFSTHPDVLQYYANMLRFILVDEYQDTNYAQQCIIKQLTTHHQFLCAVGDDAQSIYGFRGANIDNILNFQRIYPETKLFKLEQNYRSTQRIVQAANSLIHKNQWQIEKHVFSRNDEGDKLMLKELASDREEAMFVCNDIKRHVKYNGLDYSDCAILYRTNSQSRAFEEQLIKASIPYRIYGGMSFYQRKEIKDITAYFRLVINNDDEEALRRIINYPARGIGDTTVQKIAAASRANGMTMWDVICHPAAAALSIQKGTMTKLQAFQRLIESFSARIDTDDALVLGHDIVKLTGITQDIYSSNEQEYRSKQEHIEEFLASIQEFVTTAREEGTSGKLTEFIHDVALLSDREDTDNKLPKVTLMTIHSAKGLEFPAVYIVGMEENIFPSPQCTDSMRKLEEERRLLYVAVTRAEKHCTLTYAKSRYRYGSIEFGSPSRFLRDIDPHFITVQTSTGSILPSTGARRSLFGSMPEYGHRSYKAQQYDRPRGMTLVKDTATTRRTVHESADNAANKAKGTGNGYLTVGTAVLHDRFGRGIVQKIEGSGDSTKATVSFENAGTKQLLLKFAKMQIL